MSKIKINDLKISNVKPSDTESFLNSLNEKELQIIGGLMVAYCPTCGGDPIVIA